MTERNYHGNGATNNFLTVLRFLQPTLSNAEKRAAELLLENPTKVARMSLTEFATTACCGQASAIRLCKRMGLSGFAELKSNILKLPPTGEQRQLLHDTVADSEMMSILERVFQLNIQTLRDTLALAGGKEYEQTLRALTKAKQICFFAIGDAMIPCEFAALKFKRIGRVCYADRDADMQLIDACNLGTGDVAIAVSHTGNTRQVVEAMEVAKKHGATTICITKLDKSRLEKLCDIKIFTATADVTPGKEIIARRVAEQAILEALYIGVLERTQPGSGKHVRETSQAMSSNKLRHRTRQDEANQQEENAVCRGRFVKR